MQKIYVVTAGSYSEYHLVALFSDEVVANKFAEENNKCSGDYYVESYLLDSEPIPVAKPIYSVSIDMATAVITDLPTSSKMALCVNNQLSVTHFHVYVSGFNLCSNHVATIDSFVSIEHARKVAVELYQKFTRVTGLLNITLVKTKYYLKLDCKSELCLEDFNALMGNA